MARLHIIINYSSILLVFYCLVGNGFRLQLMLAILPFENFISVQVYMQLSTMLLNMQYTLAILQVADMNKLLQNYVYINLT